MATMYMEAVRYDRHMTDTRSALGDNVGYLIWLLSARWRATMDRALAAHGLTQAQYSVLAPLYSLTRDGTRPSQRELADVTGLDAVYVSKLVRALEKAGMVARATHATDPRAIQLSPTDTGVAAVEQTVKVVYKLREQLTAPLGGNDGARTAELAAMLRELLDAPTPDGPGA